MVSPARGRERGTALLIALIALLLLATAIAMVSGFLAEQQKAAGREAADLRLTALLDAGLAEALARLAAGSGLGVGEHNLGGGTIASEGRYLGDEAAELVVHAELRGERREARAEVDLSGPLPRVRRWERVASDDGS